MSGTILEYAPLGQAMCDVRIESGWYQLSSFVPTDGLGPLPCRGQVQEIARAESATALQSALDLLLRDWNKRWFGVEHGKYFVGIALVNALHDLGEAPRW